MARGPTQTKAEKTTKMSGVQLPEAARKFDLRAASLFIIIRFESDRF
jgi:hypothetical protein